jgi:hypothetical protein
LAHENLDGSYEEIFERYLPQLARKWHDYRKEVLHIPCLKSLPYSCHLNRINDVAYGIRLPQYGGLMKSPKMFRGTKNVKKKDRDESWFINFITNDFDAEISE